MRGGEVRQQFHVDCYERKKMADESGGIEGKYGTITASEKKFHPGEPVFLIRGTDPFAAHSIIDYARRCQSAGCPAEHVDAAFDQAMKIADWQRENPEKVKALPD